MSPPSSDNIVVAFTGASGSVYGVRLVEVLLSQGATVHLVVSPAAHRVFETELDLSWAGGVTPEKLFSRGFRGGKSEWRSRAMPSVGSC